MVGGSISESSTRPGPNKQMLARMTTPAKDHPFVMLFQKRSASRFPERTKSIHYRTELTIGTVVKSPKTAIGTVVKPPRPSIGTVVKPPERPNGTVVNLPKPSIGTDPP